MYLNNGWNNNSNKFFGFIDVSIDNEGRKSEFRWRHLKFKCGS